MYDEPIDTYEDEKYGTGLRATVRYDSDSGHDNPRDWDNCWTILTNQGPRYNDIDDTLDPDDCMVECSHCEGTGESPDRFLLLRGEGYGYTMVGAGSEAAMRFECDRANDKPVDGTVYIVSNADCPKCEGTGEVHDIDAYLREHYDAHLIVPVYKYEHGLVRYSASTGGNPFNCEWDSGMIGVAVISEAKITEEWGKGYTVDGEFKTPIELALSYLDGELDTYTSWCNGEIYLIAVEDEDGDVLECVGGFYDDEKGTYVEYEAKSMLEYEARSLVERTATEARERTFWAERDVVTVGA